MKPRVKILLLAVALSSFASCKKETIADNLIGNWVREPVSPGGNTYLKITDNTNFETGYSVGPGYTKTAQGTYNYTANQVTFFNQSGPFVACSNVPGTYQYKVSGNQLTLTVISDGCVDSTGGQRSNILSGNWTQ